MKAVPFKVINSETIQCDPEEAEYIRMKFPGPMATRTLPIMIGGTRKGTRNWTWNGDTEKPTVKPSVKTTNGTITCHSWVNDGQVKYLSDSSHELAGQTLDLLDCEIEIPD